MSDLTRQTFDTADVLRLEIERDPAEGELLNLFENPDGLLGGWGWLPGTMAKVDSFLDPMTDEQWLEFWPIEDQTNTAYSVPVPCNPGSFVRAAYTKSENAGGDLFTRPRIRFLDAEQDFVEDGPAQAWSDSADRNLGPNEVPAGCFYVQLVLNIARNVDGDDVAASGRRLYVKDARLGELETEEEWPGGGVPEIGDMPSHYFEDVIEIATSIGIKRAPLDAGTLTVTLVADALSADVDGYGEGGYGDTFYGGETVFDGSSMRPGKNVILTAIVSTLGLEARLFTGEVQSARVDYDLAQPEGRRALITLNAVDGAAKMTAKTHAPVSYDVNDIHSYLLYVGIPWNVNGATSTDPGAALAASVPGSNVLDQVIRTRDTNLRARVWIDANGVLMARSGDVWNGTGDETYLDAPTAPTLKDENYNGNLTVAYDTSECINSVVVTVLSDTDSQDFGPFERPRSIARWGRRRATYTIVDGIMPDAAEAKAVANTILNLTAEPELRVSSVTLPMLALYDPISGDNGYDDFGSLLRAQTDIYDPIPFRNDNPEMELALEAVSIEHTISRKKWLMTVGLGVRGRPPLPTSS